MKSAIFLAAAAVAHASNSTQPFSADVVTAFGNFMTKHGKVYSTPEELTERMAIFNSNLQVAEQRNKENILAGGNAAFGVTKFMDMSPEEFKKTYLTYTPIAHGEREDPPPVENIAVSKDWRNQGAVTPVKDQGRCGSCWAFSATEAIESYAKLAGQPLMQLSPQQINSCDNNDGGCQGGNTETAFQYVASAGGLQSEADYPYTSGNGRTGNCLVDKSKFKTKITGYTAVKRGEANLKTALNSGPVSICLAAEAFQTYSGGILRTCDNNVDHCVQGVGYDDGAGYWLVRNSWGTGWGEAGYIRVAMGSDLCRIADDVTFPKGF